MGKTATEKSATKTEPHVHGPECAPDHHHSPQMPSVRETPKVGRNEPCSCGSGNKYKKCCGK